MNKLDIIIFKNYNIHRKRAEKLCIKKDMQKLNLNHSSSTM